jgi:hypothetical protein
MNHKPEHLPFCQSSAAKAASCPGCRSVFLQLSPPLPEMIFQQELTQEDQKFLAELAIAF